MSLKDKQKAKLLDKFERSFHVIQLMRVWVDDETQELNVKAHSVKMHVKGEIPMRLGMITGNFDCSECELTSLHNAPHTVMGNFSCYNNKLTSLVGGPRSVGNVQLGGGTYSCTDNLLTNFEGAPEEFSGYFVAVKMSKLESVAGLPPHARLIDVTWNPGLPLLRLTQHKHVNVRDPEGHFMNELSDIINDHAGKGKAGAIKCAAALIKAGYKGNARW